MTYLDTHHVSQLATADGNVSGYDLQTVVTEVNQLRTDLQACISSCHSSVAMRQGSPMSSALPPQSDALRLDIQPNYLFPGLTKNLTITCDARSDSADLFLVYLLQLHKVTAGGFSTVSAEIIFGAQQPTVIDNSLITRSQVSGRTPVLLLFLFSRWLQ